MSCNFLYEHSIAAYLDGDAITKNGGFIISNVKIDKSAYLKRYIISDVPYCQRLQAANAYFHFDTASINNLTRELLWAAFNKNSEFESVTTINPFCDGYYKEIEMKVEVSYIGKLKQRIPLFLDCEDLQKYKNEHNGIAYDEVLIPTYIITKVFTWKFL